MRADTIELRAGRRLTELENATATWRSSFARPAIAAVKAGREALAVHSGISLDEDPVQRGAPKITVQLNLAEATSDSARMPCRSPDRGDRVRLGVLVLSALLSLWLIRRFGRTSRRTPSQRILTQFTEAISFAADDTGLRRRIRGAALLFIPTPGHHILKPFQDRRPRGDRGWRVPEVSRSDALDVAG